MNKRLAAAVRARAGAACEYCQVPDAHHPGTFEIEHVLPRQHRGPTTLGNLAYACLRCNRSRGTNLAGIDRLTSRTRLVRVFNPRRHKWKRRFRWDGPYLVGRTSIGRVTVELLAMNDPVRLDLREELIEEEVFSLEGEP